MTAIATKKRLYEKALDSLTSTSQISLASSDLAPKRPANAIEAFDEARERARKRLRHSTSSGSLPPIVVPSPASTSLRQNGTPSKDPPNYAPWSHDAFLARLKTFSSVSLWHPKPESVNEVQWAKRGWVCTDVNTVRCKGGCEKREVVSLEQPAKKSTAGAEGGEEDDDTEAEESAFEKALAERYHDVIVSGHAESCLWRKGGCKDDIYHLQVVRPAVWQPALRQRFKSLRQIHSAVDNVTLVSADRSNTTAMLPEKLLHNLPTTLLDEESAIIDSPSATKALEIALHGWRGTKEAGSELLHCDACFQRIGLWMYQPGYRPSVATEDDDDENAEPSLPTLHLVQLHREHCPWRSASSQKASGSLTGLNACEILQRVVSTFARDHKRRSEEQRTVPAEDENSGEVEIDGPAYSKEEVARQDKERESRLQKLKGLFNIKRRSTKPLPKAPVR